MIINTIKIENISSFKGEHVFHFNHTPTKTITIIFGENGAGKTSILQAFKIGLYGQFLFNNKNNYHTYLNSFIRRGEASASVELHFQLQTLSGVEEYTIRRNWQRIETGFKETLSVLMGKEPFKGVTSQFYQEFIFSIIPIGMMELFFFDGEKINSLGEALSFGDICNAVKKLIGISAIDALEEAVKKSHLESIQGTSGYEPLQKAIKELEANLAKLHQKGESLHQQYAETNDAIKKYKKLLANKEITFFETGGNLASSHEVLKDRQKNLQQRFADAEAQIRDLSQDYLPLCVLAEELSELASQLLTERDDFVAQITHKYAQEKNKLIEQALIKRGAPKDIINIALEILSVPRISSRRPIHGLSIRQTDEILGIIKTVDEAIRPQALEAFTELRAVSYELDAIESALEKAPVDANLAGTLSEMKDIAMLLAKHEKDLEELIAQKKRIEVDVNALENKKQTLLQQVDKQGTINKSDELLRRFPCILQKIKTDLFERRLQTLQRLTFQNIKTLFRKNQLIHRVRVASDFSIKLFGKDDEIIDLKCLSAGEQQMLATSIQWALSTLASDNIPTVIDTPLARLDSHHRKSLVQAYYPIMKQLILLSTDEEINESLLLQLRPGISDIYYLKHNKPEECTEVMKIN